MGYSYTSILVALSFTVLCGKNLGVLVGFLGFWILGGEILGFGRMFGTIFGERVGRFLLVFHAVLKVLGGGLLEVC